MSEFAEDRNLDPTPRRRRKAREQGHVVQSRDLVSAATLLLGLILLMAVGGGLVGFLSQYMARQLGQGAWLSLDAASVQFHFGEVALGLGRHLLPLVGLMAVGAVAASLAQTGLLFLPHRVAPDLGRLNPLGGLGRLFSPDGFSRFGLGLLKLVVIGSVASFDLYARRDAIAGMSDSSLLRTVAIASDLVWWTLLKVAFALLVLAALDYAWRRLKHERELKMTPQEFREEMRDQEGDPALRWRRRELRRELAAHSHRDSES